MGGAPVRARLAWAVLLAALLWPAVLAAQIPPNLDWRTIDTPHFRVTFAPGLEELAQHVAVRAEVLRERLAAELLQPPERVIDIVLADNLDYAAGWASVMPRPRIALYAYPPIDRLTLGYYHDWIDLLLLHELVHIVHLDPPGRVGRVFRSVFGRAPVRWPIFPAMDNPTWVIEGLATYLESRLTGYGRVHGSISEMMVRTAALEGELEGLAQAEGLSPVWPGPLRPYVYGALFFDWMAETYGEAAAAELVRRSLRRVPPLWLGFDRLGAAAGGPPLTESWRRWQAELEERYRALEAELAAQGLTETERLTERGYFELHARVSPGGRTIAFTANDGRHDTSIYRLDAATAGLQRWRRHNGLGPISWTPDGGLVTGQLEFTDPYHVRRDLYHFDLRGRERRLTRAARYAEPDVAPAGGEAAVVEAGDGTNRLAIVDLRTGRARPLTEYDAGVHWSRPRWDPAGDRLAAGRWRAGVYDIVVLDRDGAVLRELAASRSISAAPAWSPDGRYLLFWSDRTGIPNLFAADLLGPTEDEPALYQVTNVLTGAFSPDVSPDARWIYFTGYRADGYHLKRVPFQPDAWRSLPAAEELAAPGSGSDPGSVGERVGRPDARASDRLSAERPNRLRPPGADGSGQTMGATPGDGARHPGDAAERPAPDSAPAAERLAPDSAPALRPARSYDPWETLAPVFWLPTATDRGRAGLFLGGATHASDIVGRHAYQAGAAVSLEGRFAGRVGYTYAGLGNPLIGMDLDRRWSFVGRADMGEAGTRDVLRRIHELSLFTTLRHPRWRSAASLTLGAEYLVRELEMVEPPPRFPGFVKPRDQLFGLVARGSYATARTRAFSISPEDGVALAFTARNRWDRAPATVTVDGQAPDASHSELAARAAAYRGLDLPGFANHVLAARLSAVRTDGPGRGLYGIGGAAAERLVRAGRLGGPAEFLPVRGFPSDVRLGTRAWSASLEYRAPIAILAAGPPLWPLFLDRLSGAVFLDAGDAWCDPEHTDRFPQTCPDPDEPPLLSAGAEIALDLHALFARFRLRPGIALPLRGPATGLAAYIVLGHSF